MGKHQREKGKRGEREAARELTLLLGTLVERTQQFKGNPHSADLEGIPGLHLEVKRTERLSIYPALEKVESESGEDCPVVLHRRNGKRWIAVMYLADLVDVTEAINRNRKRAQTCP